METFTVPREHIVRITEALHTTTPNLVDGGLVHSVDQSAHKQMVDTLRDAEIVLFGRWEESGAVCQCPGLLAGLNRNRVETQLLAFAFDNAVQAYLENAGFAPDETRQGRLRLIG